MSRAEMLPPSVTERRAAGKQLRRSLPLAELGVLSSGPRDPLGILAEQNRARLQELVPLRIERMSENPFAFYRGTAAIMAADLAGERSSGVHVPSCGDAHVANFGFYASRQRTLMFDLNDFDEAAWAPWEWDLKRLVASIVIAGQATGRGEGVVRDAVLAAVRAYARSMYAGAHASPRDRYFTYFDAKAGRKGMEAKGRQVLDDAIKDAKKRTTERATRKLTAPDESGVLRFIERPPTMIPLRPEIAALQEKLVQRYFDNASPDVKLLLRHYSVADSARRVVGVGSVGTRCALTLFQDGDGHTLILQSKEANQSVLQRYGAVEQPPEVDEYIATHGDGGRVVAMQRIMQAVSDPFLGSLRKRGEADGLSFDLYVRQFHDMKGGIDAEGLPDKPFVTYSRACAVILARAHSQSLLTGEVSGYVGGGRELGEVLLGWGYAYADRARGDYEQFVAHHAAER